MSPTEAGNASWLMLPLKPEASWRHLVDGAPKLEIKEHT